MLPYRVRTLTCMNAAALSHHVKVPRAVRSITTNDVPKGQKSPASIQPLGARLSFFPQQATIDIPDPAGTAKKQVLECLKKHFRMRERGWFELLERRSSTSNHTQAVVILATPSFAKWLDEDATFIPLLLGTIARGTQPPRTVLVEKGIQGPKELAEPPFEVDVVCACVDGLAPNPSWMLSNGAWVRREGLSFLHGPADQIVPGLWEAESTTTESSPNLQSSLVFSNSQGPANQMSTARKTSEVTLPLANTLFVNGKHSTLLISKWQQLQSEPFTKVRSKEKRNQVINVLGDIEPSILSSHMPAIPITPVRRIVSGLGNIVRQLDFAEGGVGPASRELEMNIHKYLRAMERPNSTINVWALITPSESLPHSSPGPLFDTWTNQEAIKRGWQEGIPNTKFIGHWLERGATLCRVLSGGGGWGVKQGLLSLDPQTTYRIINDARFDYSSESVEEQQDSALGRIAKPKSFIQFFVGLGEKSQIDRDNQEQPALDADLSPKHTVLGTVPNTVDEIPGSRGQMVEGDRKGVSFIPGLFGAVSESGLYLNYAAVKHDQSANGLIHSKQTLVGTKVDLPFACFYTSLRNMASEKLAKPEVLLPQ